MSRAEYKESLERMFQERLEATEDGVAFPIRTGIDETEETIRLLWEIIGHFGDDVGPAGSFEYELIARARQAATSLQAAMLAAVVHNAERFVDEVKQQRDRPAAGASA